MELRLDDEKAKRESGHEEERGNKTSGIVEIRK